MHKLIDFLHTISCWNNTVDKMFIIILQHFDSLNIENNYNNAYSE